MQQTITTTTTTTRPSTQSHCEQRISKRTSRTPAKGRGEGGEGGEGEDDAKGKCKDEDVKAADDYYNIQDLWDHFDQLIEDMYNICQERLSQTYTSLRLPQQVRMIPKQTNPTRHNRSPPFFSSFFPSYSKLSIDLRPSKEEEGGFLPGEMTCAVAIIAHQLEESRDLDDQCIRDFFARIVSFTYTSLRILNVRYDPEHKQFTCDILGVFKLPLANVKETPKLDLGWAEAIALTLEA
ncbi:hypothetical protein BKA64DRAFT_648560 [Cadophora sp. MPI-SDFR-AT-0126]|nr:hypothetical protein BKA64DRAFT_648560 [Leotiomycetes sp. MPI-SDFR-AT-0126]